MATHVPSVPDQVGPEAQVTDIEPNGSYPLEHEYEHVPPSAYEHAPPIPLVGAAGRVPQYDESSTHVGAVDDQLPPAWHVRDVTPDTSYPALQVYGLATELIVRPWPLGALPLVGAVRSGQ